MKMTEEKTTSRNFTADTQRIADHDLLLAISVFEIIISFFGSAGNLLTCFAVIRNKKLHHATNFYVLSLSVADFLVTSILVPVRAAEHLAIYNDSGLPAKALIDVAVFVGRATILSSLASLTALSIDRYLALKYPIVYRVRIRYNFTRTFIIVACLWILSVLLTTIPMFPGVSPFQGLIVFVVFVSIMTLIIFITSWKVLKLVKQLFKRLKKFTITKETQVDSSYSDHFSSTKSPIIRTINGMKRTLDTTLTAGGQSVRQKPFSSGGNGNRPTTTLAFDNKAFHIEQQPVKLIGIKCTSSVDSDNSSISQHQPITTKAIERNTFCSARLHTSKAKKEHSNMQRIECKSLNFKEKSVFGNNNNRLGGVSSLADGHIAKTIAIITGAFVFCVYPRIILILYHFAVPENRQTKICRLWLKVLLYINSIVNPVLYAWRFRDFRREFFYLIRKLKRTIC